MPPPRSWAAFYGPERQREALRAEVSLKEWRNERLSAQRLLPKNGKEGGSLRRGFSQRMVGREACLVGTPCIYHPGMYTPIIHHPGMYTPVIHHPCSMAGYTPPGSMAGYTPPGYVGRYTTRVCREIYHPGIYASLPTIGRCTPAQPPCVHPVRASVTRQRCVGVTLLAAELKKRGLSEGCPSLSHPENKPSPGQKWRDYGQETRYRESCCTRSTGISQPLLTCSQTS